MASSRPVAAGDHVFLVDGSSFIFRAYFQSMNQDQKYNSRSRTGCRRARSGCSAPSSLQFVREGAAGLKPTHLAIVFDKSENTFRKELYAGLQGQPPRPAGGPDPPVPADARGHRGPSACLPIELAGYEADDLIATYASEAEARGADVLIVSSDKDLMQLVGPRCRSTTSNPAKGKPGYRPERNLDEAAVAESWECLPPERWSTCRR